MLPRELQTMTEAPTVPLWWSRIASTFDGVNLARCEQKIDPPANGAKCPKVPKTCFFGTQDCDGYGAHPKVMCFCDGSAGSRTWKCSEEKCPVFPPPSSGCTADGLVDHSSNDSLCPELGPISGGGASPSSSCVTSLVGKGCSYGSEKWYVSSPLLSFGNLSDPCLFIFDLANDAFATLAFTAVGSAMQITLLRVHQTGNGSRNSPMRVCSPNVAPDNGLEFQASLASKSGPKSSKSILE